MLWLTETFIASFKTSKNDKLVDIYIYIYNNKFDEIHSSYNIPEDHRVPH